MMYQVLCLSITYDGKSGDRLGRALSMHGSSGSASPSGARPNQPIAIVGKLGWLHMPM
jgi:hypothetical protein